MASLRDTVKQYQEELRDGIAWIAFWREGRSWNGEDFYLDAGDSLTAEQKSRLEEIRQKDPAAVILNSYYCGYLAGDMTVDEHGGIMITAITTWRILSLYMMIPYPPKFWKKRGH